jgi:membrane protein YqaA with SNARE-associated domain
MWVIHLYGLEDKVAQFKAFYDQYGLMVILVKGLTPIPFKLITIMSGAMHFDIPTFIGACIVTRGFRFFIVAALLRIFGEPIRAFIEKRLTLVFFAFLILLVGGFVAVTYV